MAFKGQLIAKSLRRILSRSKTATMFGRITLHLSTDDAVGDDGRPHTGMSGRSTYVFNNQHRLESKMHNEIRISWAIFGIGFYLPIQPLM